MHGVIGTKSCLRSLSDNEQINETHCRKRTTEGGLKGQLTHASVSHVDK